MIKKCNVIITEWKEADPPPIRLWHHQHNGRWLWTTDSDRRTPLRTIDNTCGECGVSVLRPGRDDHYMWRLCQGKGKWI